MAIYKTETRVASQIPELSSFLLRNPQYLNLVEDENFNAFLVAVNLEVVEFKNSCSKLLAYRFGVRAAAVRSEESESEFRAAGDR